MIISCEKCNKKFELSDELVPDEGRLLQCGSCNREWFFKKNQISIDDINTELNLPLENKSKETPVEPNSPVDITSNVPSVETNSPVKSSQEAQIPKEIETIISQAENKIKKNLKNKIDREANNEIVSNSNVISNFFSYLIVCIISFIGLIILVDTFEDLLINIFPGIENLLFSLFETLKDIKLFIIDLI